MGAAVLILIVMLAMVLSLNPSREDFIWFLRLRRPAWLRFERRIPLIWLLIFVCFYASAVLTWASSGNLWLMAGYGLLLLLVQSYTLVICRSRRLRPGTVVGGLGWLWGVILSLLVAEWSTAAGLLLVPYLLWSPVGTFVTWQMQRLNR